MNPGVDKFADRLEPAACPFSWVIKIIVKDFVDIYASSAQ
jgi:hypothetical protein